VENDCPGFDVAGDEDHGGHDHEALGFDPAFEVATAAFEPCSGRVSLGSDLLYPMPGAGDLLFHHRRGNLLLSCIKRVELEACFNPDRPDIAYEEAEEAESEKDPDDCELINLSHFLCFHAL